MNLEILLGAKLDRESCLTDIISRNCARNDDNFVLKDPRNQEAVFVSYEKIKEDRGSAELVKRLNKDSTFHWVSLISLKLNLRKPKLIASFVLLPFIFLVALM